MSGGAVTGKFRNKTSINGKHWLDFPVVHTSMTWHNMTWHDMVLTWHDWTLHCLTLCQVTLHFTLKGILINFPMAPHPYCAPKKYYIAPVTSTTISYIQAYTVPPYSYSPSKSPVLSRNLPGKRWVMAASSHWNSPLARSAGIKAVKMGEVDERSNQTNQSLHKKCRFLHRKLGCYLSWDVSQKRASEKDMTTNGIFLWKDVFLFGFHSVRILAIPSNEGKVARLLAT